MVKEILIQSFRIKCKKVSKIGGVGIEYEGFEIEKGEGIMNTVGVEIRRAHS